MITTKDNLKNRADKLEKIINSKYPISEALWESHERRVANAKEYLDELNELIAFVISTEREVKITSRPTFENALTKADLSELSMDGHFCRLALICNYHEPKRYIITFTPIPEI